MKKSKIVKTSISVAIILLIWTIITKMQLVSSYVLPSPSKVFNSFIKMIQSGEIFEDIYISYLRVLQGFFIATLLAFLLAMVRVTLPKYNDYYENIIQFLKNVPPLSLIPLLILWLGIGETTKISIIVLTSFFPIYLNTVKGFESCDKKLLEVGEVYGYSKISSFFKIRLPNPFTVFKYIGKNEVKTIIDILVVSPIPSHNIKSGIKLSGGTFFKN